MDSSLLTKSMATGFINGLMVGSLQVGGIKESSMALDRPQTNQVLSSMDFTKLVRD